MAFLFWMPSWLFLIRNVSSPKTLPTALKKVGITAWDVSATAF